MFWKDSKGFCGAWCLNVGRPCCCEIRFNAFAGLKIFCIVQHLNLPKFHSNGEDFCSNPARNYKVRSVKHLYSSNIPKKRGQQ